MKTEDWVLLVAIAAATWMLTRPRSAAASSAVSGAAEINNAALPGQPGWGWTYYDSGVAISPAGDYYLNGALIWKAGTK